jgi:uncharacterized membrane-anchored protein YhcB (DUF1043 family)
MSEETIDKPWWKYSIFALVVGFCIGLWTGFLLHLTGFWS